MGDKAVNFLGTCKPVQPFSLSISFHAPHAEDEDPKQYIWPPECDNLYINVKIPGPKATGVYKTMPGFAKTSFNRMRWWQRFCTPVKYQEMVKGYYRMISGIDMVIGRVIEELKKLEIDSNTVIIIMGDNGYFLGERGFGGKFMMYEPSLRVPLIIYDPRISASRRNIVFDQMALNLDIAPTILAMAGIDIPEEMQGRNLVPLLSGKNDELRNGFLCEYLSKEFPSIIRSEGFRTERCKYLRYIDRADSEELYDLAADPLEETNLADDQKYKDKLLELRTLCDQTIIKLLSEKK